jgi:flap endonuclease-1
MGVKISKLVAGKPLRLEDIAGRAVGLDAFNVLYQFITTIRQPDGTPLRDREGKVTSHLSGVFYRTASLLEMGIRPAYVFDGSPPKLKARIIEERRAARVLAEAEWHDAVVAGDMKKALTKASQSSRLEKGMVTEAQELLGSMGVPWMTAPGEGEAQMSHMARTGDVWAGASQDFDAVLFGAPKLVRNLTLSGRRRLPSGHYADVSPELVTLADVLSSLEVTREQLVDMAVLMGTDFNEGVKGIGPKKSLALIKRFGDLEGIAAEGSVAVPQEFEEVRRIFLEPDVTEDYELVWSGPDEEEVRRIMCDLHGFSVDRIDTVIARVRRAGSSRAQSSLDSWG